MELLGLKIKMSMRAVVRILKKPTNILIMLSVFLLVSNLIIWALNLELIRYIAFSAPLSIGDKIGFFTDVYKDMLVLNPTLQSIGILLFSALFAINIAVVIYVIRNLGFSKIPKKSGGGGLFFAILGGGCVACGVSILAPLVATFGAASTVFLEEVSMWFNWIGVGLVSYSIYKLGSIVAHIKVRDRA